MATLNIGGQKVKVGDEFLSLSPDQQQAAVEEISKSLGSAPQPKADMAGISNMLPSASTDTQAYQRRQEFDALPMWAKPLVAADDLITQAVSGASYGLIEKGIASAKAGIKGTSYEEERGKIDNIIKGTRDRAGVPGMVANIGGAVASPMKLAKMGVTATKIPKVGSLLGLTADGAALGAVGAYGNDEDVAKGAAIGAGLGFLGDAATRAGSRVISPFVNSPDRAKSVAALKKEGVELTAGQASGSKALKYAESEIGGKAAEDFAERQGEQFTKAALKRVGENANRANPEVIDRAFTRIGQGFDDLSARNALIPDQQVAQELTQAAVDYASQVAPSMRVPVIEQAVNETLSLLQTGRMDGAVYKTMRSNLDRFARGASQPEAKMAAREVMEALDDAMERSIARTNPNDLGKWKNVRKEYRNLLVIERAGTATGEGAAQGIISPAQLRNATVTKQGRRNYARGKGDFADLARAGEAVMKTPPNSGTASRQAARLAPNLLGGALGGTVGGSEGGGIEGALIGFAAGTAAPWAVGRTLMSKPVRSYLGNQAMANVSPEARQALARMLAAGGGASLLGYQ